MLSEHIKQHKEVKSRGGYCMNIGIDVDGVLTDYEWYMDYFTAQMERGIEIRTGESNMLKRYCWTEEQEKKFHRKHFMWYVRKMPIRENVAATIRALREEGHRIYIITARAYADRKTWFGGLMRTCLKRWLAINSVEYDKLVFVDWKNSAEEKAEWAKKLSVDVFLEDTVENIDKLKEICKVICLRAGYNEGLYDGEEQKEKQAVTYANDFYDVYSLLGAKAHSMDESCTDVEQWKAHYRRFPFDEKELIRYRKHYRRLWYTLSGLMKAGLHLEITGQENIPEEDGVIFVCNHRRSLDIPLVYLALGGKHARFLCKKEYELSKLQATVQGIGTIFVNRSSKTSSKTARRTMIQTLLHGGNVLIFPEGTRNKTEQILLPFRYGAVRIAGKTGARIVPMVIKKLGKKSFRIVIGKSMQVGAGDKLEEKNRELWEYMKGMLE